MQEQPEILQLLKETTPGDRAAVLAAYIQSEVAAVLGLAPSDAPSLQQGFFQMGMDSLMAGKLKTRIETSLGFSLSPTLAFNYPTIETLAEYLVRDVLCLESVSQEENNDLAVAAAKLEQISEEEMEALLLQKLATL